MRLTERGDGCVRSAFAAADYRVDANALRGLAAWKRVRFPTEALLEIRDGRFAGWTELARFDRDGKRGARFYSSSGEYGIELVDAGLGAIVELDPALAVERDRVRTDARIAQEP